MTADPSALPDSLATWQRIRARVPWSAHGLSAGTTHPHPAPHPPGDQDSLTAWVEACARPRGQARADRLLSALALVRDDAIHRAPLTFGLLAGWQRLVLGADTHFRDGDAYAKGGRERYALTPHTRTDFARCLAEATAPGLPLPARAARVYLDVAFFHPFPDGNGRAALLTLAYVLLREDTHLARVGPLQTARYPDDPHGAASLADLVSLLTRGGGHQVLRPERPVERRTPLRG
ncbi:Fic family protein [Streptomyces sp. NBC_00096]|uniref:Fic family protein n=1 Tax=Streptomyces sp. NBC_00096 TaxID=2975650 RepID=UPI0032546D82